MRNSKIWNSTYQTTALLSEISIFWVRDVCEIQHCTISKLWIQTHIATSFWYNILCILTLITWKLQVVHGCSTYRMTDILSEMSIFFIKLNARYNWWVMIPNMHRSLFLISHLCVLTHIHVTWKLQVTYRRSAYWMTALLLKTFLVCYGVAWEIWLESYDPRYILIILWYKIVMCILQTHTYITIWCATMHYNNTDVPYDCILHTKRWIYCQQRIIL